MGLNDINSLSHTRWNCKYHIVFAPKYRRKVFYQEKKAAIGKILRQLCEWKGVKIIEAEACPNHIHLFVEIPPKMSVSHFMGYLKGKSIVRHWEQVFVPENICYSTRRTASERILRLTLTHDSNDANDSNLAIEEKPSQPS